MLKEFLPAGEEETVLSKLFSLKQSGSATSYSTSFNTLVMQLQERPTESTLIHLYRQGLNEALRRGVTTNSANLATLHALQLAVERLHSSTKPQKDTNALAADSSNNGRQRDAGK